MIVNLNKAQILLENQLFKGDLQYLQAPQAHSKNNRGCFKINRI